MEIIKLDSVDSTNSWVIQNEEELPSPSLVYCVNQTAGRGQRGNSWESEPGKNVTASLIFHPENFPACQQFFILEAVALALTDFLREEGVDAKVKWPNDIYVGDKKIGGTLVEHYVTGKNITRTVAGFGLNLNQEKFYSDAPNPVSLTMLTGKVYDIDSVVKKISEFLEKNISTLGDPTSFHENFIKLLWRNDGEIYPFFDRKENRMIKAKIDSIAADGILTLLTDEDEEKKYAFKEVEFVL